MGRIPACAGLLALLIGCVPTIEGPAGGRGADGGGGTGGGGGNGGSGGSGGGSGGTGGSSAQDGPGGGTDGGTGGSAGSSGVDGGSGGMGGTGGTGGSVKLDGGTGGTGGGPEPGPDAGVDRTVDAGVDRTVDAGVDRTVDAGVDRTPDAPVDAPPSSGTTDCKNPGSWPAGWVDFENRVLAIVNQKRAAGGKCGTKTFAASAALTMQAQLQQAARCHSMDMAKGNFMSHTGSNGSTAQQRIESAGYTGWRTWGENVARSQSTPEAVMTAWMNSQGHCENIMNSAYRDIGVGYVYTTANSSKHYWTQDFAAK